MEKSSLTFQTLRNVFYGFAGYLWPFVITVFITPFIVLKLGTEQFGLFLFINTLSSFIGIAAVGLGFSAIRSITEHHSSDQIEGLQHLEKTFNTLFLGVSLCGVCIILFGSILQGSDYMLLFVLTASTFFINTLSSFYQLIPNALQRFDIGAAFSASTVTALNVGYLILVSIGYGLSSLFVWQLCVAVTMFIIVLRVSKKLLPQLSYRLGFSRSIAKKILAFGSMSALTEFSRTTLFSLDRLLIPIFLGTSALSYYALPGSVAARIPATSDNLSGVIFPATTHLHTIDHQERLKTLYLRSSRLIITISIAITANIIFTAENIMRYWLSEDFALYSTDVLIVLCLTNFVISLFSPAASFMLGTNKMKLYTGISVLMALLNIGLLALLLPLFGILGAAWAYFISVLPILYGIYSIEKRYLKLNGRFWYYLLFAAKHFLITSIMYAVITYLLSPFISSFASLALLGPAGVLLYLCLYYAFGFLETEDKRDLEVFTRTVFKKLFFKS